MKNTPRLTFAQRVMMIPIWLICQLAHVVGSVIMFFAILAGSRKAFRLAVSYDQLANAAFGGDQDETISSRAARARIGGERWGCVLCKLLDVFDQDHCDKALERRFLRS